MCFSSAAGLSQVSQKMNSAGSSLSWCRLYSIQPLSCRVGAISFSSSGRTRSTESFLAITFATTVSCDMSGLFSGRLGDADVPAAVRLFSAVRFVGLFAVNTLIGLAERADADLYVLRSEERRVG